MHIRQHFEIAKQRTLHGVLQMRQSLTQFDDRPLKHRFRCKRIDARGDTLHPVGRTRVELPGHPRFLFLLQL